MEKKLLSAIDTYVQEEVAEGEATRAQQLFDGLHSLILSKKIEFFASSGVLKESFPALDPSLILVKVSGSLYGALTSGTQKKIVAGLERLCKKGSPYAVDFEVNGQTFYMDIIEKSLTLCFLEER
jgi:hypothetical protein